MGGADLDVAPQSAGFGVQRGDARSDGVINIADALFIAQYLVGLRPVCTDVVDNSCLHSVNTASVRQDAAFDEKTIADALFIAQYLVGLRDEIYNLAGSGLPILINITSPDNLRLFNASPITVSGTISESAVAVEVNQISATLAAASFTVDVALDKGTNTITAIARDAAGNVATDSIQVALGTIVASAVDPSVTTTLVSSTEFLYSGENPIQTGVAPSTIEPIRVAVLRGKVTAPTGTPLLDVTITILNHPEFGQTLSRADGMFDLAVNGGGLLTVRYVKEGFLTAQRQVDAPWQDYALLPDVVLMPLDAQVTAIDLSRQHPHPSGAGECGDRRRRYSPGNSALPSRNHR